MEGLLFLYTLIAIVAGGYLLWGTCTKAGREHFAPMDLSKYDY